MNKLILIITLFIVVICTTGCMVHADQIIVGKKIREADFKEFYYTYSTTVNPPEFQRYRIYAENGKRMFYHEKREGDSVFLTEEDITVSGEIELTSKEWETFWNYISGGTVKDRKENTDSGGSGPWLYLCWSGDNNKCQEFTFENFDKETEFENFCMDLKSR